MSKYEMLDFIRSEVKDYEKIMNTYAKRYGTKSTEYKLAEERYITIWVLANDLGVKGI